MKIKNYLKYILVSVILISLNISCKVYSQNVDELSQFLTRLQNRKNCIDINYQIFQYTKPMCKDYRKNL